MNTRHTLNWIALLALAAVLLLLGARPAAAAAAPITVPFDHLTTGFELDGVHRDLPCEQCHLNAVFKGTPRDCGTCHITGSQYNATPKTATHIASTNNCAICHNTIAFRPDVHFEHSDALGTCVSCHNGTIAQGEGPNHPATSTDCAACHTVISWNPPKAVDHTQIPMAVAGFCIICHNGVQASGKNAGHLQTTLECGDCHTTTSWLGANFDHTGITTGCFSCHNGTKAVGKQASHMPTTNLCENCHTTGIGTSTPSWVPSAFDHTQMTVQTCMTCHNGTVKISTGFVSGQPTNHVPVINPQVNDCSLCHGNTPSVETWTVLAASIPILHTGVPTTNCLMCHAGQTFAGVPAPYTPMTISGISPTHATPLAPPHIPILASIDCSACHGNAYTAGGFGPATPMSAKTHTYVSSTCNTCHDTGKAFYVGSGTPLQLRPADHVSSTDPRMATGDCSLCHETTDWNSSAMPAGHMPNPSNLGCAQCHASAPSDYTPATLAAVSALHTGITGNCGLCHGNNVAALTWFNNYTPKDAILTPAHIPYLAGTDCSSCHAANFVTGGFGPTNMSAAKHAFVPTSCDTCHEAGLSFYLGASTPALQGRPADHIASGGQQATGDCGGCHTTTDWTSNTYPPGHMPNPGNLACSVCHTAIGSTLASYATLASVAVLHTGITGNCGQCHGSNVAALTWYNNYTPKDAILTPAHIPYLTGSDCSSCHASNFVTGGFGPTNMSAAKHAFVPTSCDTCHEAGLSFYLGASTPALQGRPADHVANGGQQATGDCGGCHTTTDWTSNTLPPGHMPNPSSQACSVCHTAIGSTLASYATLASVAVLHTGITGGCGQCHGSNVAALTWYNNYTPKDAILTPAHIPYLSGTDCSSCHATNFVTGGFGPTNMSAAKHAFVPTTCDTCHEAGLSFYLGASTPALQGRPADHVANGGQQATGDCSGCHTTTDWSSNNFPAGHMPNPGNQACSVCHTAIGSTLASYATLASIAVLHTGISSGCEACHGGPTAALTFYNNNDNPKAAAGLSPSHIPYSNGVDCVSCHAINYATGGFGGTTMSAAKHAFVPTTCDTCHEAGLSFYPGAALNLQGRPATHISAPNPPSQATGDCSLCHNTTTWTTPTTLPNGHMPIPGTQTCSVCHTGTLTADPNSYAQLASIAVLHTGVTTGCAQCHGGATALTFYNNNDNPLSASSLSPAHIPAFTGEDCSACHTPNYVTGGFGPMNMTQATHSGVGSTCDGCHEAGLNFYMGSANPKLQGRPTDHTGNMAAPADCSGCHTTANWNSTTLPAGHMPNPGNQVCNTCHTAAPTNYATLASVAVLHTGISGGCAQCHGVTQLTFYNNNDNPKSAVLSPAHIPLLSGADCGACHAANFVVGGFGPMNMTQATHAQVTTTCITCHEAGLSFYMGAANPGLQGRPADHTQGQQVAPNDCSLCHTTANWNSNTLPAGHMPNPGNQACSACHTAAPTNYATMASIAVLHTGISSGCAQCHGVTQLTFYNNNDNPKSAVLSPAHIPINSGADCGACHAANFVTGGFGPMNMTQATHAQVGTTCVTCHEAGLSFYMGAANPGLQGRPADHTQGQMVAPNDCSLCHTTANWNSNTLPAGHMPNPGNQACTVCHTAAPTNYATMASIAVLHTGITNACATCHGMTQLTFYNNNDNPKAAVLSPAHIPINSGTDCGSCHASNFVTGGFGPMNMTQATHSFVSTTCATCHGTATVSFYMGAASPTLQLRPADHTTGTMLTGDCSGCHTTANWNSTALPAGHMPNPGNQGCTVCHTAAPTNYTTLAANAVLHTGITSGCITCHGAPNATAPVFYLNFTPKPASGLSPVHIPTSTTACESCHSNTTFTSFSGTTMSSAKHTAMFAVIGKTCDGCHDASTLKFYGVTNLTTRPSNHHVGQDCSGCHNTNNWNGGAAANKKTAATTTTQSKVTAVVAAPTTASTSTAKTANVAATAASATNTANAPVTATASTSAARTANVAATTASATTTAASAVPTTASATARGVAGGVGSSPAGLPTARSMTMSHVGVTANCASCHNGVLATGKGPTHIASNAMCQNCHTTTAWLPARFEHQGVTASCVTCHNGALAPGKPTRHLQTTQDCGTCHNTFNWQSVAFNHVGVSGTCLSCHNGITATGKQPQHLVTTQDCSSCHNTLNWNVTAAPPKTLRPLLRGGHSNPTSGSRQ